MPPQAPSATAARSGGTAADRMVRRQRRHDGATDPLDRASEDQVVEVGASAASAEPAVKMAIPMMNIRRAPEAVAERGAGEQQHGERQRVGIDHPLEVGEGWR